MPPPHPDPDPHDTAEFTSEEILQRLELGRLALRSTEGGERLEVRHVDAPPTDRRRTTATDLTEDRRRFQPMELPMLYPETGPIGVLLVGGFADDGSLKQPLPFWRDERGNGTLIWQALARAGYLLPGEVPLQLGQGGCWDATPPKTHHLAMAYVGYRRRDEVLDVERVLHSWNIQRLQTLVQACQERSEGPLKVVAVGEVAWFMMCACAYGLAQSLVLTLPEPRFQAPQEAQGLGYSSERWVEWATDLLAAGPLPGMT